MIGTRSGKVVQGAGDTGRKSVSPGRKRVGVLPELDPTGLSLRGLVVGGRVERTGVWGMPARKRDHIGKGVVTWKVWLHPGCAGAAGVAVQRGRCQAFSVVRAMASICDKQTWKTLLRGKGFKRQVNASHM